jgi:hypothetical protein
VTEADFHGEEFFMMWEAISMTYQYALVQTNGDMNAIRYINDILEPYAFPVMDPLWPYSSMTMLDHTNHGYLEENNVTVHSSPSRLPDLSPTQHF